MGSINAENMSVCLFKNEEREKKTLFHAARKRNSLCPIAILNSSNHLKRLF